MNISLSLFTPENLVSRDRLGSAVPSSVSLLISILRLNLLVLTYGIPLDFRGGVHLSSFHRENVCLKKNQKDLLSIPQSGGKKCQNV